MYRQLVVLGTGRASKIVPRKPEALAHFLLRRILVGAKRRYVLLRLQRRELGGRTVLIGRANEQRLVAPGTLEARIDVRRKHRANKVSQMLDAVDVRQGGRDQVAGHGRT